MGITLESQVEEETKIPSVSEARVKFDKEEGAPKKKLTMVEIQPKVPAAAPLAPKVQSKPKAPMPEVMPKKVVPPVKKPVPTPAPEKVKSPSPRLINFIILHLETTISLYEGT